MKKAINKFKIFWGKYPAKIFKGKFHDPKQLVYLGDAIEIVYRSNKNNGGGDGTMAEYKHTFKRGVKLYADETLKKQLYIIGTRLKVIEAGIVN